MKESNKRSIYAAAAAFFIASVGQGAVPAVRSKAEAPADLQMVFAAQDDTESRRSAEGLELARRTILPTAGVESSLLATRIDEQNPALVVMAMDRFPSSGEWRRWQQDGLLYVEYLGQKHWLVELTREAEAAYERTRATAFIEYQPLDKIAPEFDTWDQHLEFFDPERYLVVLNLAFLPKTTQASIARLRGEFHRQGVEHLSVDREPRRLTIVTEPSNIDRLALMDEVLAIVPGAWTAEPLMDGVRAVARAENVLDSNGKRLTGVGVRAATNEQLGDDWVGKEHHAFWDHDAAGEKTSGRWTDLAEQAECGISFFPGSHGLMTGGVLLGNGWNSEIYSGVPFSFQGIAPGATFECYWNSGAHAHVSSHSYTGAPSNATVVGASTEETHHAHIVALGNSGLSGGYYSVLNGQKNLLGVANAQVNGEIYAGSSAGPTSDGRIKPDLSAPTGNSNATITAGGFSVEISRIRIVRDGENLFDWSFLSATPEGWGQTASALGRSGVEVLPFHGRIEVLVDEAPWSGWGSTPVVGTEVDRFGNLIDFVGEEDDVLKVDYRAYGLERFDLKPLWFRDHPNIDPDCDVDLEVAGDCPWFSQSFHGGLGFGDGQWNTMEVPIGQAGDWNQEGVHPFWDDEQTWAEETIQFLGFRFSGNRKQPTPSYSQYYNGGSGGTSGASPVLGGAYALAMGNLTRLYRNVDLDQRLFDSVYYASTGPTFTLGMPLNSTWKALFVHTADDMIRTDPAPGTPPNPDTGVANVYHAGPDYTTGYGMVDIQSAIDLMNMDAAAEPIFDIVEFQLKEGDWQTYELEVSDAFAGGDQGLKVTLVWDDSPTANSLVNNLSLILQAPDGTKYYPWSLKVPALPVTAESIVPAQRDQPNDRDTIEQVLVDDVEVTHSGTWKIHVIDSGMGDPLFVQKYSLVSSPWQVEGQCHSCG